MPAAQPKPESAEQDTRVQLIKAAEKLFGESGIDAVSLRQINLEAGQKNSSAAHYHFGDKKTLIMAIYEARMHNVNQRREKNLDEMATTGTEHDIRALTEAFACPIVEEMNSTEGGSYYVRFMAQAIGHPQLNLRELSRQQSGSGLGRIMKLMQDALPEVPAVLLGQRFGLAFEQLIHSLADQAKLRHTSKHSLRVDSALFISNLIDCIAGSVSVPVSTETQKEFDRLTKSSD